MNYLHFKPKPTPGTNTKWQQQFHQKIISALGSCSKKKEVNQLHALLIRTGLILDIYLVSRIISFFSAPSAHFNAEYACRIFEQVHHPDVFLWNTMIKAYTENGFSEDSFFLFRQMLRQGIYADNYTYPALVKACCRLRSLETGKMVHGQMLKCGFNSSMIAMSGLVNLYANCGRLDLASYVFEEMPERDVVSWTTMIFGYVRISCPEKAFILFDRMRREGVPPNKVTLLSLVTACAQLQDLDGGRRFHSYIVEKGMESDLSVCNSLVNMYAKCGCISSALQVFWDIPPRNSVSWNALIAGFCQSGLAKEALKLFWQMDESDVRPTEIAVASALSACAQLADLVQGGRLHSYIKENKLNQDVCLGNALIDMYAKCGSIEKALSVFHNMSLKDIFSWNAMIGSLAVHGHAQAAIDLFKQMEKTGWIRPDHVTFTAVLSACAHSGMLSEGYNYFNSMSSSYYIAPRIEHYGCMVDLLGRAGLLAEAGKLIDEMPFEPDLVVWGSLLAACRVHRKVELGEKAARKILELKPNEEGVHVVLSNIYAEAGRWEDAKRIRALKGGLVTEKSAGYSSIEVDGIVREFLVQDQVLPEYKHICCLLKGLMLHLKD